MVANAGRQGEIPRLSVAWTYISANASLKADAPSETGHRPVNQAIVEAADQAYSSSSLAAEYPRLNQFRQVKKPVPAARDE
jgi:hypothetical protein